MIYLLDTNIFVILINQEFGRLSARHKEILSDQNAELVLSTASIYEMSIKERLTKLQLASGFENALDVERKILKINVITWSA
jgi:PIN domain nuclease of toxin-antitoxin system